MNSPFKVGDMVVCMDGYWAGFVAVVVKEDGIRFTNPDMAVYLSPNDAHYLGKTNWHRFRLATPLEKLL